MTPVVRALPMWQPWASLVVHGKKKVETRHWPAPQSIIGQRIAIHATETKAELGIVRTEPFRRVLCDLLSREELPLGALIGTVVVAGCDQMTVESCARVESLDPVEYAFGHWSPGRFAWRLYDPAPLPHPVPWRGSQGIFSVPVSVVGIPLAQESLL